MFPEDANRRTLILFDRHSVLNPGAGNRLRTENREREL
jgi:hypothetical protein